MPSDLLTTFGEQVRSLRIGRGFTQEGLGERTGLHRTYIGGLERGERNPTLETVGLIAVALGVPAARLLTAATAPPQGD